MKKVDKGFELLYCNLSHRRRFIRTIWLSVLGIPLVTFIFYITRNSLPLVLRSMKSIIFIDVAMIIIAIIQAIYEYKKWKAEE